MKTLKIILLLTLTVNLSSCSWLSSFYIVNRTRDKIIISYTLKPKTNTFSNYALGDTLIFNKINSNENSCDKDLIGDALRQEYSQKNSNGLENYTIILDPNTSVSGGQFPGTSYYRAREEKVFDNISKMNVIRLETKDTIEITPTLLYNFTRPFGKFDLALVFE